LLIPSKLLQRYKLLEEHLRFVKKRLDETFRAYGEKQEFLYDSRIKSLDSLLEKIETGRYQSWDQLDDLVACAVVLPNPGSQQEVISFCESKFHILDIRSKDSINKHPEQFSFDSTRLWGRLRPAPILELGELPAPYSIKFEIQIRSAFEHAWQVATHDLVYKSKHVDWRRTRLGAQAKAIVEQLDLLILAFDHALNHMSENPWAEFADKRYIAEVVDRLVQDNCIPNEALPKDLSRFCDNMYRFISGSKVAGDGSKVSRGMEIIEREIRKQPFPMSLTLFQYAVAMLVSCGFVESLPRRYRVHLTDEMLDLFPSLQSKIDETHRFDYGKQ